MPKNKYLKMIFPKGNKWMYPLLSVYILSSAFVLVFLPALIMGTVSALELKGYVSVCHGLSTASAIMGLGWIIYWGMVWFYVFSLIFDLIPDEKEE